jgi:hypothetical protein
MDWKYFQREYIGIHDVGRQAGRHGANDQTVSHRRFDDRKKCDSADLFDTENKRCCTPDLQKNIHLVTLSLIENIYNDDLFQFSQQFSLDFLDASATIGNCILRK